MASIFFWVWLLVVKGDSQLGDFQFEQEMHVGSIWSTDHGPCLFFSPWALESCLVTFWFLVLCVWGRRTCSEFRIWFSYMLRLLRESHEVPASRFTAKVSNLDLHFADFSIYWHKSGPLSLLIWQRYRCELFFAILVLKRLRLLCVFLLMLVMGVIIAFRIEPQTSKVEKNNDDIKPFMCPLTSAKCFWWYKISAWSPGVSIYFGFVCFLLTNILGPWTNYTFPATPGVTCMGFARALGDFCHQSCQGTRWPGIWSRSDLLAHPESLKKKALEATHEYSTFWGVVWLSGLVWMILQLIYPKTQLWKYFLYGRISTSEHK